MPQPRPLPAHPWAEGNEPIPPGYPPAEVSYVLQVERGFLDDARYCIRDLLEARPTMSLDAATAVAVAFIDTARREWRAALLAATGAPHPEIRLDATAMLDTLGAVSGEVRAMDATNRRISDLRAEVDRLAAAGGRKDAEITRLSAEVVSLRARLAEHKNARHMGAGESIRLGPGPDRGKPRPGSEEEHAKRCMDFAVMIHNGEMPMDIGRTFVGWAATKHWLQAHARYALGLDGLPADIDARWLDDRGVCRADDPDFREVEGPYRVKGANT